MKTTHLYACESCGTEYRTSREAQECEARAAMAVPSVAVGDIVTARAGFAWYDGEREWISNADRVDPQRRGNPGPVPRRQCPNGDGNCFNVCCTFLFYYVVTHIDNEPSTHRPRYHLVTKAMVTYYQSGYTFDTGHYAPTLAARVPAAVRLASRALIGKKAEYLL